jgi:hypothetical protein
VQPALDRHAGGDWAEAGGRDARLEEVGDCLAVGLDARRQPDGGALPGRVAVDRAELEGLAAERVQEAGEVAEVVGVPRVERPDGGVVLEGGGQG